MFLSGTTNIQPGDGVSFTLDRDALAAVAGSVDPYFQEKDVFKEVICLFKEKSTLADRGQRKSLLFRAEESTAQIVFSSKVNEGAWELDHVLIKDFDGGECKLTSSQIPDRNFYDLSIATA